MWSSRSLEVHLARVRWAGWLAGLGVTRFLASHSFWLGGRVECASVVGVLAVTHGSCWMRNVSPDAAQSWPDLEMGVSRVENRNARPADLPLAGGFAFCAFYGGIVDPGSTYLHRLAGQVGFGDWRFGVEPYGLASSEYRPGHDFTLVRPDTTKVRSTYIAPEALFFKAFRRWGTRPFTESVD